MLNEAEFLTVVDFPLQQWFPKLQPREVFPMNLPIYSLLTNVNFTEYLKHNIVVNRK